MSGFASELRTVRLDRNDPLLVPLAASVVLMLALVLQLLLPSGPDLETETRNPRILPTPSAALRTDYPAIVAHPVFAPDRQPDADSSTTPAASSDLVLKAVARAGEAATALILGMDGQVHRVPLGGEVDGWKLKSADAGMIVLQKGALQRVLRVTPGQPVPIEAKAPAKGANDDAGTVTDSDDEEQ